MGHAGSEDLFVWNALRSVSLVPMHVLELLHPGDEVGSNKWATLKSYHLIVLVQNPSSIDQQVFTKKSKPYAIIKNELALLLLYIDTCEFVNLFIIMILTISTQTLYKSIHKYTSNWKQVYFAIPSLLTHIWVVRPQSINGIHWPNTESKIKWREGRKMFYI